MPSSKIRMSAHEIVNVIPSVEKPDAKVHHLYMYMCTSDLAKGGLTGLLNISLLTVGAVPVGIIVLFLHVSTLSTVSRLGAASDVVPFPRMTVSTGAEPIFNEITAMQPYDDPL
jgi:hypothetical protein